MDVIESFRALFEFSETGSAELCVPGIAAALDPSEADTPVSDCSPPLPPFGLKALGDVSDMIALITSAIVEWVEGFSYGDKRDKSFGIRRS